MEPKRYVLFKEQVEYLCLLVGYEEVSERPEHVQVIKDWLFQQPNRNYSHGRRQTIIWTNDGKFTYAYMRHSVWWVNSNELTHLLCIWLVNRMPMPVHYCTYLINLSTVLIINQMWFFPNYHVIARKIHINKGLGEMVPFWWRCGLWCSFISEEIYCHCWCL